MSEIIQGLNIQNQLLTSDVSNGSTIAGQSTASGSLYEDGNLDDFDSSDEDLSMYRITGTNLNTRALVIPRRMIDPNYLEVENDELEEEQIKLPNFQEEFKPGNELELAN